MEEYKKTAWNSTLSSKKPLRAKSSLKSKKPFLGHSKRIKQVSKRRQKENSQYLIIRDKFLRENRICERCQHNEATQVHHKFKRFGKWLCEVSLFMATCANCHRWIEDNQSQAEKKGWVIRRLNVSRQKSRGEGND